MNGYDKFEKVFGQLTVVTPEDMDIKDKKRKEEKEKKRMELGKKRFFKNETIKDYNQSPGNYGKERFILYCESGNIYSTFIKQAEIDTIKERYEQGDMVQVTYTERPDKNDPDKVYLNLEGMSEVRREVSEEQEEQGEEEEQPEPEQAVLEPEKPVKPTLNEKEGSGKGEGRVARTMSEKDVSIVRQVAWKCSAWILQALDLGDNVEKNIETAVNLAHAIEEDINR